MARYIDFEKQPFKVRLAAHCIGLDYKRPYIRHGKAFYRPYRNYFETHDEAADIPCWMELAEEGLAKYRVRGESVRFWLTESGLAWLGGILGVKIYPEEDLARIRCENPKCGIKPGTTFMQYKSVVASWNRRADNE